METRTQPSPQKDLTKKLTKFLIDNYPKEQSWQDFLTELNNSDLTIEEKLECVAKLKSKSITNKERYTQLVNILLDAAIDISSTTLKQCSDAPSLIQFTQSRFINLFDMITTLARSNLNEKINALLLNFIERLNLLPLAHEKVKLLLYQVDNLSIRDTVLSIATLLSVDSKTAYLQLINNIYKSDPETAPLIWLLINSRLKTITVKSLAENNVNNTTVLFKLIRHLHEVGMATNEIVDFLQSTHFGSLVRKLDNPWLSKNYYAFIKLLLSKVKVDDKTLGRLYGWSTDREGAGKNTTLLLSLTKEHIPFTHIQSLLRLKVGKLLFSQAIMHASAYYDHSPLKLHLKILQTYKKRGISSMSLIDYFYAGTMEDNFIAHFFRHYSQSEAISDYTTFFMSLIDESVDMKRMQTYLSADQFFAHIRSLRYDDYYFSPFPTRYDPIDHDKELSRQKIAAHVLFNLQAMTRLLDVGADAEAIMRTLEVKDDANLNMGHYVFRSESATIEYLNLLYRLIMSGISADRVLSLFVIDSPKVTQTHLFALLFFIEEHASAKAYVNFLIALCEINIPVGQFQRLLTTSSIYWPEAKANNMSGTFCEYLVHRSRSSKIAEQLLFSLAEHDLIPVSEFALVRYRVFEHIKILPDTERALAYIHINNPQHPLGRLMWISVSHSFLIWRSVPALPPTIAEYMRSDPVSALTISEESDIQEMRGGGIIPN